MSGFANGDDTYLKMNDIDQQLLQRYTRDRAEDAFAELVRRHLNLVYSAALRQVQSPQLAKDVSQSVFNDLARSAGQLKQDTVLSAWLYEVTRRTSIDFIRQEMRRKMREQAYTEMKLIDAAPDENWREVLPHLDAAMEELDGADRAAVLLRFFENKSLREVGAELGVSDDAARKRIDRAVERLRKGMSQRGVTVTAGGLIVLVSANAVQAAPAGLAITISAAAPLAMATTAAATKTIVMTTLQKTVVAATACIVTGAGIYEVHQARQWREQVHVFQQQQEPLDRNIEELTNRLAIVSNQLVDLSDENRRLRTNTLELLRLRATVTRLRRMNEELTKPTPMTQQNEKSGAGPFVPASEFRNAGLASPEAAVQTLVWAARNKDKEMIAKIVDVEGMKDALKEMMKKANPAFRDSDFHDMPSADGSGSPPDWNLDVTGGKSGDVEGYQILSQEFSSPTEVTLVLAAKDADGSSGTDSITFHLINGEWKMDLLGSVSEVPVTISTKEPDGSETKEIVNFTNRTERTFVPVPGNSTNQ